MAQQLIDKRLSKFIKFETGTKGLIFFKTPIPDDTFFETLVI